jgi:predicted PurR-regulated permease PerM
MGSQERIEQIVVIALLVILAAGCLTVLQPLLPALLWALVLSFSTWPLHAWLVRRLNGRRTLAAALMTLLVAAIFILPLAAAGTGLADSVAKVAGMVTMLLEEGPPDPPAWVADLPVIGPQLAERWLELERLGTDWTTELQPYLDTGRNSLLSIGVRLGEAILQVSLGVLAAFFFFRDGAEGARRLSSAVERLAGHRAQRLLAVAGGTIRSVVYGVIGTALAQATLQAIGLWLGGVPAPFFLGFLTFFLSFVPIGPPLIWLPAAVWLLYKGALGWGLFLAGWGFFVVSGVDNVLRPYLISRQQSALATSTTYHKSVIREARPLGCMVVLRHWKGVAVSL